MDRGLQEPAPARVEGVVAGIGLQRQRRVGVGDGGVPASDPKCTYRRRCIGGGPAGDQRRWRRGGSLRPTRSAPIAAGESQQRGVGGDSGGGRQIGVVCGPAKPGAQVVELGINPIHRERYNPGPSHIPNGRRPGRRSRRRDDPAPRRCRPWRPVVLRRTGGSSPTFHSGYARALLDSDQRLAHQRIQQIQHGVVVKAYRTRGRRRRDRIRRRTPSSVAAHPLVVAEEVIRPLHRLAQRLVALQPPP